MTNSYYAASASIVGISSALLRLLNTPARDAKNTSTLEFAEFGKREREIADLERRERQIALTPEFNKTGTSDEISIGRLQIPQPAQRKLAA